jgi:peptidoglycan/xylan/chitin deacetylase (PgdA/CDA1 family)
MYHSVSTDEDTYSISPEKFQFQIEFIKSNFSIIRLNTIKEVLALEDSTRKVVITFDDAFQNFYENALPILDRYKVPCTLFIPTGHIGGYNVWDAPFHDCSKKSLLNKSQLFQLKETKLVDFGSHGIDHSRMSALSIVEMRRQSVLSKSELEELFSIPINMFAYPFGRLGDFSQASANILKETGYEIAVTSSWGTQNSTENLLSLKRISLKNSDSSQKINSKIQRIDHLRILKEQLIFLLRSAQRIFPGSKEKNS